MTLAESWHNPGSRNTHTQFLDHHPLQSTLMQTCLVLGSPMGGRQRGIIFEAFIVDAFHTHPVNLP